MKFSEINYQRPDLQHLSKRFDELFESLSSSSKIEEQREIIDEIYKHRSHFETMSQVASIHNSIDTTDSFYEQEQNFYDENYPHYQDCIKKFYKVLLSLKNREDLEK